MDQLVRLALKAAQYEDTKEAWKRYAHLLEKTVGFSSSANLRVSEFGEIVHSVLQDYAKQGKSCSFHGGNSYILIQKDNESETEVYYSGFIVFTHFYTDYEQLSEDSMYLINMNIPEELYLSWEYNYNQILIDPYNWSLVEFSVWGEIEEE